jgi:Flp pilus assembly pilin Flp
MLWTREGNEMTQMFMQAFFAVRGAHSAMLQRARVERGASMVEYALLVGLIAVVAVVGLLVLGPAILNLFDKSGNCVTNLNNASCNP